MPVCNPGRDCEPSPRARPHRNDLSSYKASPSRASADPRPQSPSPALSTSQATFRHVAATMDAHASVIQHTGPVEDCSNTGDPRYLRTWIAEVTLVHPDYSIITKFQEHHKRAEQVRVMKATMRRYKQGAVESNGRRFRSAQRRLEALQKQLDTFEFKHGTAMQTSSDVIAAFVVFNCADSQRRCVDDYAGSAGFWKRFFQVSLTSPHLQCHRDGTTLTRSET